MSRLDDILANLYSNAQMAASLELQPNDTYFKQEIKDLMLELINEPDAVDMFVDGVMAIDKNYLTGLVQSL